MICLLRSNRSSSVGRKTGVLASCKRRPSVCWPHSRTMGPNRQRALSTTTRSKRKTLSSGMLRFVAMLVTMKYVTPWVYFVCSGGFCNTMNWAATGCLGGYLRIWDLSTYQVSNESKRSLLNEGRCSLRCHCSQCRHVCRHPAGVIKLMWHPTQPIIYAGTVEGLLYVWDARNGALLKTLAGHTDMVLDMTFIPGAENGNPLGLLTASDDESVRLFKVEN